MSPIAQPAATDRHLVNKQQPPPLEPWIPPHETQQDLEWASLETIDLNLLDSQDPHTRKDLVARAKKALVVDGFMLVTGSGVTQEQIERQTAIAQLIITGIPEEDKLPYAADLNGGSFSGYKLRGIWEKDGVRDNIEHYNFESKSFQEPLISNHPPALSPYLAEIEAFASHIHNHIVRKLCTIVSLVLELPEETLWNLHDQEQKPIGNSNQRYMGYHPRTQEEEAKTLGIWGKGHTDYNSLSLLFSQPISALQILTNDNKWKYVSYKEGAVVVNVADALQFVSGEWLKATRHRVITPPTDQQNILRLILIHFARFRRDLELNPLTESPLLQREGYVHPFQSRIDEGGRAPTQAEWLAERIRRTGREAYEDKANAGAGQVTEVVLGKKVTYYV